MYLACSSRLSSAFASQLTRTRAPLSEDCCDLPFASEFTPVGFHNGLLDLLNLPFIQIYEISDGLCGDKGLGSLHRLGELLKAMFEFRFQTDG